MPIEEVWDAVAETVTVGKARRIGPSEMSADHGGRPDRPRRRPILTADADQHPMTTRARQPATPLWCVLLRNAARPPVIVGRCAARTAVWGTGADQGPWHPDRRLRKRGTPRPCLSSARFSGASKFRFTRYVLICSLSCSGLDGCGLVVLFVDGGVLPCCHR
ncbi:hypothetical protein [Streptomyces sp. NPDC002573]|uniref:hypothetical protein n=1 Tax=Streptomyces sp. NPDC002573 TaxID=3364651 RepID=UPI003682E32F